MLPLAGNEKFRVRVSLKAGGLSWVRHEHSANNAHNVKILIFTSSSFPGRSSKCSWGGRVRVRVRSKNENDSGGPRERKPRPRRDSFLVARNRSSIVLVLVLVLVLVSAIGCKIEDVGVPKSNKLALMGLKPRAEPSRPLRGEIPLNLAPFRVNAERFPHSGTSCCLLSACPSGTKPFRPS